MRAIDGHHGVVRKASWISAAWLLLGLGGVAFATTAAAATNTCAHTVTMTVSRTGLANLALAVKPSAVKVQVGDCVAFHNATHSGVTVTVTGTSSYGPVTLTAGATTGRNASFAPQAAGTDSLTATTPLVTPGHGTIAVSPAPSPTPTPTTIRGSTKPSGGHSSSPAAHPTVASSPKHSKSPSPRPTGVSLPPLPPLPSSGVTAVPLGSNPVVAPGPVTPTPSSTSTATASPAPLVLSGPLEPADNNRRGLPEAVGVCVVLGLATGWGRVLLASPEAVDDDPNGDHRL